MSKHWLCHSENPETKDENPAVIGDKVCSHANQLLARDIVVVKSKKVQFWDVKKFREIEFHEFFPKYRNNPIS